MGYLLDSGNRSGIGLVGWSPWTAADARLLAGRPGGRPRARVPAPHRSKERGLPESSRYPNDENRGGFVGQAILAAAWFRAWKAALLVIAAAWVSPAVRPRVGALPMANRDFMCRN